MWSQQVEIDSVVDVVDGRNVRRRRRNPQMHYLLHAQFSEKSIARTMQLTVNLWVLGVGRPGKHLNQIATRRSDYCYPPPE